MPEIPFLRIAVCGCGLLLFLRLRSGGLDRLYPWFSAFLLSEALLRALSTFVPIRSSAYASFYYWTEPVVWICCLMMAAEAISAVLRQYPAVATVVRRALVGSAASALAVSLASVVMFPAFRELPGDLLERFMLLERAFHLALLALLTVALPALSVLVVPLPRRTVSMLGVLLFFLFCKTGLLFVRSLAGPSVVGPVTSALLILNGSCYAAWGYLLSPASAQQETQGAMRHGLPISEARLMAQLESLSLTLMRAAGR